MHLAGEHVALVLADDECRESDVERQHAFLVALPVDGELVAAVVAEHVGGVHEAHLTGAETELGRETQHQVLSIVGSGEGGTVGGVLDGARPGLARADDGELERRVSVHAAGLVGPGEEAAERGAECAAVLGRPPLVRQPLDEIVHVGLVGRERRGLVGERTELEEAHRDGGLRAAGGAQVAPVSLERSDPRLGHLPGRGAPRRFLRRVGEDAAGLERPPVEVAKARPVVQLSVPLIGHVLDPQLEVGVLHIPRAHRHRVGEPPRVPEPLDDRRIGEAPRAQNLLVGHESVVPEVLCRRAHDIAATSASTCSRTAASAVSPSASSRAASGPRSARVVSSRMRGCP